jgi:hypothetical protein
MGARPDRYPLCPDGDQILRRSEVTRCATVGSRLILFDHLVGTDEASAFAVLRLMISFRRLFFKQIRQSALRITNGHFHHQLIYVNQATECSFKFENSANDQRGSGTCWN